MQQIGHEFAKRFAGLGITKIVTIEASALPGSYGWFGTGRAGDFRPQYQSLTLRQPVHLQVFSFTKQTESTWRSRPST